MMFGEGCRTYTIQGEIFSYLPKSENTIRSELWFRSVLDGGLREVRFERVSPNVG
jgi:hypothetical protein